MNTSIAFIGAGNMGGALVDGLLSKGIYEPPNLIVSDQRRVVLDDFEAKYPGIHTSISNANALGADVIVFAIKPQLYEQVISPLAPKIEKNTVLVSIAAGITLAQMSSWAGSNSKIIRAMPNTPALVYEGMTALCSGKGVDDSDFKTVEDIFLSVGRVVKMPENLMDVFTALSGSSPAWVFMFIEALADGAVKEGMPRSLAYDIASQAVLGSAKLVRESKTHPAELKDMVCSPAGTTIAALASLEGASFRSALIQAVEVCTSRAKELGTQ